MSGVEWECDLDSPADASPVVAQGKVLIGTIDGVFWAVEETDGHVLWRAPVGAAIVSAACVTGGLVVFGAVDGYIHALQLATGREAWRTRTGGAVVASPVLAGDRLLCGSADGRLYALAVDTGAIIWTTEAAGEIHAGAAVTTDAAIYATDGGAVYCVSVDDGTPRWSRPYRADGPVVGCPVVDGGVVLVSSLAKTALTPRDSLNIHCIDLETGKRVWGSRGANPWATEKEKIFSVSVPPTVIGDQVWFVTMESYGNWSAALRSAAVATGVRGALIRKRSGGAAITITDSSPAVAGNTLYIADYGGDLYAVDTTTGRTLASIALGSLTMSSPAISGGAAFIGTNDGRLLCIR